MISEAERISVKTKSDNIVNNNKRFKFTNQSRKNERYEDNRQHLYSTQSKKNCHFRSMSKSQDRIHDNLQYEIRQKQEYKKPMDDNYVIDTLQKTHHSTTKKWQKMKILDKTGKHQLDSNISELKAASIQNNSNVDDLECKEIKSLTEAEMNKLGAKIVKAEIMGNTVRCVLSLCITCIEM